MWLVIAAYHLGMLGTGTHIINCEWKANNQFGNAEEKSKRHVICDLLRIVSNVNAVANEKKTSRQIII